MSKPVVTLARSNLSETTRRYCIYLIVTVYCQTSKALAHNSFAQNASITQLEGDNNSNQKLAIRVDLAGGQDRWCLRGSKCMRFHREHEKH